MPASPSASNASQLSMSLFGIPSHPFAICCFCSFASFHHLFFSFYVHEFSFCHHSCQREPLLSILTSVCLFHSSHLSVVFICLSIFASVYFSVYYCSCLLIVVCLSPVSVYLCVFTRPSVLSVCLCIFICLHVCLFVYLPVCTSVYLSVCLCLCVCIFLCRCVSVTFSSHHFIQLRPSPCQPPQCTLSILGRSTL